MASAVSSFWLVETFLFFCLPGVQYFDGSPSHGGRRGRFLGQNGVAGKG
jgi:hypothetical protein